MPVSKQKIVSVLRESPKGLKARKIAEILGVDKKEVNSILYKYRDTAFLRDDKYVWTLNSNISESVKRTLKASSLGQTKDTSTTESKNRTPTKPTDINEPIINNNGIDTNKIHNTIFFNVAGCWYYRNEIEEALNNSTLKKDERNDCITVLEKEPSNKYDKNAIRVLVKGKDGSFYHVGYVPKELAMEYLPYVYKFCTADIKRSNDSFVIRVCIFINQSRNFSYIEKKTESPATKSSVSFTKSTESKSNEYLVVAILALFGFFVFRNTNDNNTATIRKDSIVEALKPLQSDEIIEASKTYSSRSYDVRSYVRVTMNDSVGNDWNCQLSSLMINGNECIGQNSIVLHEYDEIYVSGRVVESDDSYPDITEFYNEGPFVIHKSDLSDGITISITDIPVTEVGGGKYSGNQAVVNAVISFSPLN